MTETPARTEPEGPRNHDAPDRPHDSGGRDATDEGHPRPSPKAALTPGDRVATWLSGLLCFCVSAAVLLLVLVAAQALFGIITRARTTTQDLLLGVRTIGHLMAVIMAMIITFCGFRVYLARAVGGRQVDPPSSLAIQWKDLSISRPTTGTTLLLIGAVFFWIILTQAQVQLTSSETTETPHGKTSTVLSSRATGGPAIRKFLDTLEGLKDLKYDQWRDEIADAYKLARPEIDDAINNPTADNKHLQPLLRDVKELADLNWELPRWLSERAKKAKESR